MGWKNLVYFEQFDDAENAIKREKAIEEVQSSLENPSD
jgi:predicted GIY-YIG superfamily endonuclease